MEILEGKTNKQPNAGKTTSGPGSLALPLLYADI